MKKNRYMFLLLAFCGCSSIAFNKSPQLKEEEAAAMTFEYPKKDVFDACVSTLQAEGWTVTDSNYEAGTISGIRHPDPGLPADAANLQRSARVTIAEAGAGKTEVKITAGLASPNPAGGAAAGAPAEKYLPKVCDPLLTSVRQTLLRGVNNASK